MIKTILFFIIMLLSISITFAQQDFRSGYIITHQNDTLSGWIDYRGNSSNAKVCVFKKDNTEAISYSPSDIKGFRFNDSKYYVSKEVGTGDGKEVLFLEFLINGIADIYYYHDVRGDHYFIEKQQGELLPLETIEKEVLIDGKRYGQSEKRYIGVLKSVLYESPELYPAIDYLNLRHKSLIKLAKNYHEQVCNENDPACIIYEKKLPRIKISTGPLVSVHFFSLASGSGITDEYYYFRNSEFNNPIYPSFGIFVNVNMPYINERLAVQYEATFDQQKLTTHNLYLDPVYNQRYYNDIVMTQNVFNNALLLKYEMPSNNFKPVIQAGPFVNYNFKHSFSRELEIKYASGETYDTETFDESPLSNFNCGITVGMGVNYYFKNQKAIQCNLRYARGFGLSEYFQTNGFSLDIGYSLF